MKITRKQPGLERRRGKRATGMAASSSVVTNPDGTKILTFQCAPR
jgi:hypothetical protein